MGGEKVFLSKKKHNELIKRISDLEKRVSHLEQLSKANTYDFGEVDLKTLCRKLPDFIDKRIVSHERFVKSHFSPKCYLCDPQKNIECKRSVGGVCYSKYCCSTKNPKYAKLDENGNPIENNAMR